MTRDKQLDEINAAIGETFAALADEVRTARDLGLIGAAAGEVEGERRPATQEELDAWHKLRRELQCLNDLDLIERLINEVFGRLSVTVDAAAARDIAVRLVADEVIVNGPIAGADPEGSALVRVIAAADVIIRAAPPMIDAAISIVR